MMKMHTMKQWLFCVLAACGQFSGNAQQASISIDVTKPGSSIPPTLHGIFFEEISHAGEGGIYAELIQNRGFEESRIPAGTKLENGFLVPWPEKPHFMIEPKKTDWKLEWPYKTQWPAWSVVSKNGAGADVSLSEDKPLNSATPKSLQIILKKTDQNGSTDVINEGFWGIKVNAGEYYNLVFYARTDEAYKAPVNVSLQSPDGKILSSHQFQTINGKNWKKYSCTLKADAGDDKARFVISLRGSGQVWLDFVSLFPAKTFKGRANGLRTDLAGLIEGLKPSFVRWPGGCYVEGITIESAPDWKNTIGPLESRPGTFSPWGYWSSDGFGYHEYLQFCEDIKADALYVFNAGVSCEYRSGTYVPEQDLQPYIQNALDAIEYAIGPVTTKYGRMRAANGHAKPFPLKYIEIGNEQHGPKYASRYNLFYEAIRKKYPSLRIMASMGIGDVNQRTLNGMKEVDIVDEHAYKDAYWSMRNTDHFDKYKRGQWDMYVGEYATNAGVGAGNMRAALADAVYILGMERNADLVKWSSYAPLLVNANDVDWPVNLINFDAAKSFGRISYYTIKMFSDNRADRNITTTVELPPVNTSAPLFTGGIGLGTWDTQAEFKDIEVSRGDKILYRSDFINNEKEWSKIRGEWSVKDGAFAQTAEGPQRLAMTAQQFDTCTISLKARRTGGLNAFMIPFAVKDSNTYLRAHIGSWWNASCVFESVTGGYEVAGISDQKRLAKPIETGRWYDVRVVVGTEKVDCYLDGELLMSYTPPPKVFALAGHDDKTGEIILKMVNAGNTPLKTAININGAGNLIPEAMLSSIAAASDLVENSFDKPALYVPVVKKVKLDPLKPEIEWPAFSVNVLRIKVKK
ncbi:carbohydrate binding domain-containing protein [Terrimonas sp. NA20]|uniref:non-reducing end alpha-L-arabinofuranosidase n=1 Tax=Terrimonas ginsenosidimutans TaxID=2908004 RepID=A0ABS9KME3_9BACT|nr:alpha-L-arabinofuranosidase C-terminal domain-containing protein [Terrimonas ginsenosidimutans]MCG2613487.1 carbohydrate binding domain-containing protein [Terrimonas ginsenosidimutans]